MTDRKPSGFRRVGLAVSVILVILCGMCLSGCLGRKMTYPAPAVTVGPAPAPLEEIALKPASGKTVVAWVFLPAAPPGVPALLFFHGNGENLETLRLSGALEELRRLGVPFLAIDYPGYGRSRGNPSEQGVLESADAAVAWLGQRCPGRPLVSCGWSMGAAVALQTAARHPDRVKGLIALSSWTSLRDVARAHFPGWMVWLLLRERYPSLETAPRIACPALVMHGAKDDLIPASQGERVAKAISRARWVPIPGAGHNDILGEPRIWEEMAAFLKTLP
jgi:pimeloyl-ACP methyl ester carboxylesterase